MEVLQGMSHSGPRTKIGYTMLMHAKLCKDETNVAADLDGEL